MPPLFNSTAQVKTVVSAVNKNMSFDTLSPFLEAAGMTYIKPLVGNTLYAAMVSGFDANTLNGAMVALLPYMRKAIAYYAVGEATYELMAMMSDMGIQEQSSNEGTSSPARQFVIEGQRQSRFNLGDRYADEMLAFLERNAGDYPTWVNDTAVYTLATGTIVHSTTQLAEWVPIADSRRAFLAIRPFIKHVEDTTVVASISQAQFDVFKANPNEKWSRVLQKAVACLAFAKAAKSLNIGMDGGSFYVWSYSSPITTKAAAAANLVYNVGEQYYTMGMEALTSLKLQMDTYPSDYPAYAASLNYGYDTPKYNVPNNRGKKSFMT